MKKNNKNFIVVIMLVLLAVVLFMGGSTYAKYITQKDVITEQATVAKWGYVITVNTDSFFGTDYTKASGDSATVVASNGASIDSSTSSKVVAPGASGYMTLDINGQAEVLSKITFTVTGGLVDSVRKEAADAIQLTHANGQELAKPYEPIKWTVEKVSGSTTFDSLPSAVTLAELETWLEGLNTKFETIAPNTQIEFQLKISWSWDFSGTDQINTYDTMLGDIAANKLSQYANAPQGNVTMNFNMNVAIEQIQDQE